MVAVAREIVSIRRMGAGVKITRKICAIVMAFAWFAVVPKVSQAQSDSASRAIPAAEEALEAATRRLGPTDPRTLSNRRMLAGLYELQGRLDDATTLMQREATTLMQAEGKNSVNLAETLNRLALIHRKAGREREANKILAQALKIYRSQPVARAARRRRSCGRHPRRHKRRSRRRPFVWIRRSEGAGFQSKRRAGTCSQRRTESVTAKAGTGTPFAAAWPDGGEHPTILRGHRNCVRRRRASCGISSASRLTVRRRICGGSVALLMSRGIP